MQLILLVIALTSLVASWWFWWAHLLTWIPATIIYFLLLRGLQAQSGVMVLSAIPNERLKKLSDESITWLNKHGHALIMWGSARVTAQRIRHFLAFSCYAILITAYRHNSWWLAELLPISSILLPLHDGYVPINKDKLSETELKDDSFLLTEIAPLYRDLIAADVSAIARGWGQK